MKLVSMLCVSLFAVIISAAPLSLKEKPALSKRPPARLNVLTFNAWLLDLPFGLGSRDTEARVAVMPEKLAATGADIIAFQEVWSQKHKEALIDGLKNHGYSYFFHEDEPSSIWMRGLFGNGLLIVSKYPLLESDEKEHRVLTFHAYTRPEEYFAAKGVLYTRVQIPDWGALHFYNTHFGAVSFLETDHRFDQEHEKRRLQQAQELFDFIKLTAGTEPVAVAGDFNSHYRIYEKDKFSNDLRSDYLQLTCASPAESCLNLQDTLQQQNALQPVTTVDPVRNIYIGSTKFYKTPQPLRVLDYVFVSNTEKIRVVETKLVLTENYTIQKREKALPLSDHYGLMSELELR